MSSLLTFVLQKCPRSCHGCFPSCFPSFHFPYQQCRPQSDGCFFSSMESPLPPQAMPSSPSCPKGYPPWSVRTLGPCRSPLLASSQLALPCYPTSLSAQAAVGAGSSVPSLASLGSAVSWVVPVTVCMCVCVCVHAVSFSNDFCRPIHNFDFIMHTQMPTNARRFITLTSSWQSNVFSRLILGGKEGSSPGFSALVFLNLISRCIMLMSYGRPFTPHTYIHTRTHLHPHTCTHTPTSTHVHTHSHMH